MTAAQKENVLAVLRDAQTCASDSRVLAVIQFDYVQDLAERIERARTAVAELFAERDSLQAKLDTNRCNSGHETLPLALWDCPECHNTTKRKLAELIEAVEAFKGKRGAFMALGAQDARTVRLWAALDLARIGGAS